MNTATSGSRLCYLAVTAKTTRLLPRLCLPRPSLAEARGASVASWHRGHTAHFAETCFVLCKLKHVGEQQCFKSSATSRAGRRSSPSSCVSAGVAWQHRFSAASLGKSTERNRASKAPGVRSHLPEAVVAVIQRRSHLLLS